ncbi:hypothetical protein CBR_g50436 [Chara braunii]|uniref:Cytosolic Fe-S cluster assembly factor NBP35 n=1 Tax=Chara braunii TaxID=69332 RepID=A0A388M6P5_CHABU|nr:hypothetical protein CBR_g50436 [Chara braunii]|eukprot:GBG90258.1 hypothetical protein CBR_g50436 [Chara braunii]
MGDAKEEKNMEGAAEGDVPSNANENCPGTGSEAAGKASACQGCPNQQICATAPKGPDPDLAPIGDRMASVKHKILVLSGKGGVGKSTFSAQLSFALAAMDKQVGLLDIDICGPSIPKMLGLEGEEIHQSNLGWSPVYVDDNLGVMSIGFMLPDPNEAVVWRGPRKNGLIKQFLRDVNWGDLDYLVVDAPPGTSDEHISIVQYLKATHVDGAIIVTTPQEVSLIDVRKEINFCKKVGIPVIGVVENMSGLQQRLSDLTFRRPANAMVGTTSSSSSGASPPSTAAADADAAVSSGDQQMNDGGPARQRDPDADVDDDVDDGDVTEKVLGEIRRVAPHLLDYVACAEVFHVTGGGAQAMAKQMQVSFLGKVPMDPSLSRAAEEGKSCFSNGQRWPAAVALQRIIKKILLKTEGSR